MKYIECKIPKYYKYKCYNAFCFFSNAFFSLKTKSLHLPLISLLQKLFNFISLTGVLPMDNHKCTAAFWWRFISCNLIFQQLYLTGIL